MEKIIFLLNDEYHSWMSQYDRIFEIMKPSEKYRMKLEYVEYDIDRWWRYLEESIAEENECKALIYLVKIHALLDAWIKVEKQNIAEENECKASIYLVNIHALLDAWIEVNKNQ
ncbi:MAG: hypothetical protein G8345_00770 [Magnetococcales bacterium]|nr:hypothetical protein [Magnetococcales bacterium]NGZ25401.1 hypothetical protein [Magnetococcales bacterium]